jgi:AcrR family transcriptional regulator
MDDSGPGAGPPGISQNVAVHRRSPRQRRARDTRRRLYETAMAEYARSGVEGARVEDIVTAAGVSWGTFFHYFPTKEDVLLDAVVEICAAYATAVDEGLAADRTVREVLSAGFAAMFASARQVAPSQPLLGAMVGHVLGHPGRLTAALGEEVLSPVTATRYVLESGQRRGEVRDDVPAEALAVVLLYSVVSSGRRGASMGRPRGSPPLNELALETALRGMAP